MTQSSKTWGVDSRPLVSVDEAWAIVSTLIRPLVLETVALAESCGRVLAAPVAMDEDYPAFDKAMMDGFAVRAADCAAPGANLKVLGLAAAGGAEFSGTIGVGEAIRINTGAPLTRGADAVVRIEDCDVTGDRVAVRVAVPAGKSVAPRGSHRRKGEIVLTPPLRMEPMHVSAAATAGAATLSVHRKPSIAILSTGDELVSAGSARQVGQIVDSNGPTLSALMRQFGGVVRSAEIVRDQESVLRHQAEAALGSDIVLVVGGMSMGTLDLAPKTFESLGVRWKFHGVDMRPGKPTAFGVGPGGQLIFGLPGNPVSAFVCSWLFVRMAVRGLEGLPPEPPPRIRVELIEDVPAHRDPRPAFVPGRIVTDRQRGLVARPCEWGGSADTPGLANANGLIYLPNPTQATKAGEGVDSMLIGEIS